jgi:vacuolar protein sorting-associated protein 11
MKQVEATSLLVTISEDLSHEPVLNVWALDKTEKKTGGPKCLSTTSIQNGRRQFPVKHTIPMDFDWADLLRFLRLSH